MRVGLFDSGVGGLTVLKTLKEKYPKNDYIYYGDTLNVPYGNKRKEELLKLARADVKFLVNKRVDIIIVACGTISANCINELRSEFNKPIISIIDTTIEYLNKSKFNNILVMATHATINSHIFKNNVNKYVYELETPKLVPLIENNNLVLDVLHEYLDDYTDKFDALVLGCTHYPIIYDYIRKIVNKNMKIIDMSKLIKIKNEGNGTIELYFSKINQKVYDNVKTIISSFKTKISKSSNN